MQRKLFVSLLLASSLFGAKGSSLLKDGVFLFNDKNYKEAYATLQKAFKQDMSNPQTSYYLGRSAFELGLYEKALIAYERVLVFDENHIRSKLEVGRVYLMLKMFDDAKAEFYEVLEANPPKAVKENVEKILASIEKSEKRTFLNYSVNLGVGYDDNINMNPGQDVLIDYLADENANPDDIKGASFVQEVVGINHIYDFGEIGGLHLDNSLNFYNQNYIDEGDYDVFYTSLSTGVGYLKDDYKIVVPIVYDKVVYGGSSLLDSISLKPRFSKKISKTLSFNSFFKYQRKMYKKEMDKGRETDVKEMGIGFTKSINSHFFDFTYSFLDENKRRDSEDNFIDKDLHNFRVGYFTNIANLFNLNLAYNFRKSQYNDIVNEGTDKRVDNYKSYLVNLSKKLNKSTSISLGYNSIDNNSNYIPIAYSKGIYTFNLNINF